MSLDKKLGEVVSAIISLVNSQFSCLVQLLSHRQSTEILENFFVAFFQQLARIFFTLMFIKPHFFAILLNLIYFSINFMLITSIQHEFTGLIGKLVCMT